MKFPSGSNSPRGSREAGDFLPDDSPNYMSPSEIENSIQSQFQNLANDRKLQEEEACVKGIADQILDFPLAISILLGPEGAENLSRYHICSQNYRNDKGQIPEEKLKWCFNAFSPSTSYLQIEIYRLLAKSVLNNVIKSFEPVTKESVWEVKLEKKSYWSWVKSNSELLEGKLLPLGRSIPKIPEGLKKDNYGRTSILPAPPDTAWKDITLALISSDTIEIYTRNGAREKVSYHELKMSDKRAGDRPGRLWIFLITIIKNAGVFESPDGKYDRHLTDYAGRLSRHMQQLFGINQGIFPHYKKLGKYQAEFNVSDRTLISTVELISNLNISYS